MANLRILYAAESIFVGPSPATGLQPSGSILQLHRVQSLSYDDSINRQDVNQLGTLAPIDRASLEPPTVNLNATYLATSVRNESGIGLYVGGDQSALKYILDGTQIEKNYYVKSVPDGNQAAGYTGYDGGVVGIGNGTLSSYSAQGAVGGFPTAQFTVQGLDILFDVSSSGFQSPAVNPTNGQPVTGIFVTLPPATSGLAGQVTYINPGDISVDLGAAGTGLGFSSICIQSYNISFDLNLDPLICLGSRYATARLPQFPVNSQLSFEADMVSFGTGRLSSLLCANNKYDVTITLRAPVCDASSLGAIKAQYRIKGATYDGRSFSNEVSSSSRSITVNMSAPIGAANDLSAGFFLSGSLV